MFRNMYDTRFMGKQYHQTTPQGQLNRQKRTIELLRNYLIIMSIQTVLLNP